MSADPITGLVFNVMRFSVHDGPGIRTTVFLKGCPLSCWWCHNPESQSLVPQVMFAADRCVACGECVRVCAHGALRWENAPLRDANLCQMCGTCVEACAASARQVAGRRVTVSEIMQEIRRDLVFFDESGGGVTFSGGEPLMQPEFLAATLRACRSEGLRTVVDTCGAAAPEVFATISGLADLFLYDLKLMDSARHRRFTGASNEVILRNLEMLVRAGKAVHVRIPVIPAVNDDEVNVAATMEFLGRIGVSQVNLLPYHTTGADKYQRLGMAYRMARVVPPSAEYMEDLSTRFARRGFAVRIGG